MITRTQAIVLNYRKYSDSSIIVNCLTEKLGQQSFLVYGIGGRKNNKLAQFQPLFILDLQLYIKPGRSLQKLKEAKISPPLFTIATDLQKSTIALFIAEVLAKSVTEQYSDEHIFEFIKTSVLFLEEIEENIYLFHPLFLIKLAKLLGILPEIDGLSPYVDLSDGSNKSTKPNHENYIGTDEAKQWKLLIDSSFQELNSIKISNKDQKQLLASIVKLYEIHLLNFNTFKSYTVLTEIFN